jgi:hypothetical protein
LQEVRQLSNFGRDPPRLVAGEQLRRGRLPGSSSKTVGVADDEARPIQLRVGINALGLVASVFQMQTSRFTARSLAVKKGMLERQRSTRLNPMRPDNHSEVYPPSPIANIKTGQIISAIIPDHPPGEPGLLHGIGWAPDESEIWESSSKSDPHVYVWSVLDPMAPKLKKQLSLRTRRGAHWLTFDLQGDYAYVAPNKNSDEGTEIFNAHTYRSLGLIGSSEDMIEIDFTDGAISRAGDQYGIGRAVP